MRPGLDASYEMNSERSELMKSGQLQFSHPSGTHDDSLWALALAVYASRLERPVYHPSGTHEDSLWLQHGSGCF